MKIKKTVSLGALFILGSSQLMAASSDPFLSFANNLNAWLFLTIGPIVIFIGLGISALVRYFQEETADKIFKNSLKSGILFTFATPLWAFFTGMFN